MRRAALLCYVWSLPLTAPAGASELWTVVEEVPTVTVRIHWVSRVELLAAARELGQRPQTTALAFSVLRKNVDTGSYTCDVYMPSRPIRTWDKPTTSLGHELAHCLGFTHE
ncbi:MAG TPA: hypothetical protein VFX89_13410 [Gammaproteobacteria bacterium]|nr:hypothetical protein [Gammaproteobacteria bacterium]